MFDKTEAYLTAKILKYLAQPTGRYAPFYAPDPEVVRNALQPGDILLVEGNSRLAATIKYLTQSTWSHAALYVGERPGDVSPHGEPNVLLEAEAETGVVTVPLSKYVHFHTRICRAVGLDDTSRQKVIDYALKRIGTQYDSQRIVDLARYMFPYPPVPVWFRRRMLSIGCGDPTRAICSTLIAEAYASIHYPILPERAAIMGLLALMLLHDARRPARVSRAGDVVLLAGKGHETYQVLRDGTIEFDDRERARAILRRKGYTKKSAGN